MAWRGAALVMAGLALFALLVEAAGFVVAVRRFFVCVAQAFVRAASAQARFKLVLATTPSGSCSAASSSVFARARPRFVRPRRLRRRLIGGG